MTNQQSFQIEQLHLVVSPRQRWNTMFINRLRAYSKSHLLDANDLTALASMLHRYRKRLPKGFHQCASECLKYRKPRKGRTVLGTVLVQVEQYNGQLGAWGQVTSVTQK